MYARISGVGAYIPARRVTNAELETIIDTSDEWIQQNIGVKTRSVIAPGETIADMGTRAAAEALKKSSESNIGLVICATNSPDTLYPATACLIAKNLNLGHVPAYDLQAGCTGFLYALAQAKAVVETSGKSVLVVGSDALSTGFNWHDRNAVLFGDGAGAVMLSPSDTAGILAIEIGAEYSDGITLKTPLDPALSSPLHYLAGEHERRQGDWYTKMNGRAIMRLSLTHVPRAMESVMKRANLSAGQIDHFLPHQTNKHVIEKLAAHIGFDVAKIPDVLSQFGSLSTAVIPVSLHMALAAGNVESGDTILATAYGAGFTYGAVALRW